MKTLTTLIDAISNIHDAITSEINIRTEALDDDSIRDLAQLQVELATMIAQFNDIKKLAQSKYDLVRNHCIPDKMEAEGVERVNYAGIGNVTTATVTRVSVVKDRKPEFFEWANANGHGGLITPSIHSSTLAGFVKEQLEAGDDVPVDMLNVNTFQQARITKN
jgi:hypothetical protein